MQKFSPSGELLKTIPIGENSNWWFRIGDIAVDAAGSMYIETPYACQHNVNPNLSCVQKFDANGTFIFEISDVMHSSSITSNGADRIYIQNLNYAVYDYNVVTYDTNGNKLASFGVSDASAGQVTIFNEMEYSQGSIYIRGNGKMHQFTTGGVYVRSISVAGYDGSFTLGAQGNIYTTSYTTAMNRYLPDGTPAGSYTLDKMPMSLLVSP